MPKGAIVSTNPVSSDGHLQWHGDHDARPVVKPGTTKASGGWRLLPRTQPRHAGVKVIGSGWTSVVEVPASSSLNGAGGGMLQEATTALPNGGRLLHTALINAVLLPDGRIFAGAVTPAALEHIAATTK